MKALKVTALALLMTAFFQPNRAEAQNFRLGIKLGANMDRTAGDEIENKFNGFIFGGAYAGVKFTKVRVQAEALFSRSTITTSDNFKTAFKDYLSGSAQDLKNGTFKMNELSIPVMVGFNLVPKLLWIEAGPQYTAVVSVKDVDGFLAESKRVFKTGYVSGMVGASLELPFSLNAGLRYVFGLSDRNNTDVPEHWKTSHIQLHVGYSFLK